MARRNANLAGLAALGALGYKLATAGEKGKTTTAGSSRVSAPEDLSDQDGGGITALRESLEDVSDQDGGGITPIRSSGKKTLSAPKKPYSMTSDTVDDNVKQKNPTPDMRNYKPRRSPDQIGAPRQVMGRQPTKEMTYEEKLAAIPTDEGKYAPVAGERVTGTETTRNLNNIMNSTAGLSVPGYVGKMTQAGYNARAAARRAAGDLTPAEIQAAQEAAQAAREAKTLNPNAWMAGPKGMSENFKKGGAVKAKPVKAKAEKPAAKGWGKARGARGAKYY